jgi:hypothetical protein
MFARNLWAFAGALAYAFFLTACGDLGMVLPSQGSYRVNAQVDGDYTLDAYSVVTKNSKIRPYFVNSVVNDPDVRGLTVFVQDYSGAIVSRKVQYQLVQSVKETPKPADEPEQPLVTPPETAAAAAPGAATDPEAGEVSRENPPDEEQPEDETAISVETGDESGAVEPDSSKSGPGSSGGISSDKPAVSAETESPEYMFGETAGDARTAEDADGADAETAGWTDSYTDGGFAGTNAADTNATSTDVADTTYDYTNRGFADADTKDTDAAGLDKAGADAPGTDTAVSGKADADTASSDAKGGGIANKDAVDTDTANTNAVESGAKGADSANSGKAGTDTASSNAKGGGIANKAVDTDTANTNAVGSDAKGANSGKVGADTADADKAGADTAGSDAKGGGIANKDAVNTDTANKNTVDSSAKSADAAGTGSAGSAPAVPAAPPVETSKPPVPEDETVQVKQLDQYLPAFRIVEELDIGRYNLVFQVMGEKEVLYRTYKPIYFIRDAKFTLGEIQSFLPAAVTGGRLIPPGINVMLETEISADPRLDPYVIWYNGKKILAQGRLSGGANYLMWKTPEQTGFHNIRAEVFPLLISDRIPGNMIGKIKELSLPVSSKSEGIQHFSDSSGEFISWHQFWGTLDDAKAPNNSERRLISLYSQAPRWIPFGGMYGLLVGRDDIYVLPGMPFKLSEDTRGTGRILLHLAAFSDGAVLNIRFAGGEATAGPAGAADLDLTFTGDALILRIASDNASMEESLDLNSGEAEGFITLIVEFTLAPDHFDAELRLEDPAGTTGPLSVALDAPLSGEGSVRFGGAKYPGHGQNAGRSVLGALYGNGAMILNELALSYVCLPIPPKEDEGESEIPETLIAEEEDPSAEPEPSSLNAL